MDLNSDSAATHFLKDELEDLPYETAEGILLDWIEYAESLRIKEHTDFAKTLRRHPLSILACCDASITTRPLEGFNNEIKTMKRQAYGFRGMDYFEFKIPALHRTTYNVRICAMSPVSVRTVNARFS